LIKTASIETHEPATIYESFVLKWDWCNSRYYSRNILIDRLLFKIMRA